MGWIGLGCLDGRGHLATAHDADCICGIHDFAQLVGDEDDGFAFGFEALKNTEQLIGLGTGSNACGFV